MRFVDIDGVKVPVPRCMVGECPLSGMHCRHPRFKGDDTAIYRDPSWADRLFPDGCPLREAEGWDEAVAEATEGDE